MCGGRVHSSLNENKKLNNVNTLQFSCIYLSCVVEKLNECINVENCF